MIPMAVVGVGGGAALGEAGVAAQAASEAAVLSGKILEGMEAAEAGEALVGNKGILEQMETIRFSSFESVGARNEASVREVSQTERNRIDGSAREMAHEVLLNHEHPAEAGYSIHREVVLRNSDGTIAKDSVTGESRRLDFVVCKDGEIVRSDEVTSERAPKENQSAKEDRIREAGGNFIKDRTTGELVPFASSVRTQIVRMP